MKVEKLLYSLLFCPIQENNEYVILLQSGLSWAIIFILAGSISGPFWIPASTRVYCHGGAFFDDKVGAHFNLVPKNEQVEPSEASRDVGTTSRSGSAQSGYSSFNSCQDSLAEKKEGI